MVQQMYSSIDPRTDALALHFCTEAELLWTAERNNNRDSLMNAAAAEFLCLGYLGQGRDHAILTYVAEVSEMGVRLGLFGVDDEDGLKEASKSAGLGHEDTRARMYAAWGIFNWITLSHPAHDLSSMLD